MMTLTEFLLARIAEDEANVKRRTSNPEAWGNPYGDGTEWSDDRYLAECEVKRRIVALRDQPEYTFRILAAIYADHPDYQQEWAL